MRACKACRRETEDWFPIYIVGQGDKPYCRNCYLRRVPDAAEELGPLPGGAWPVADEELSEITVG